MSPNPIHTTAQADAEKHLCSAYHLSHSYGQRAEQLTLWKRFLDFVSLGVAPGIVLLAVDKPFLREAGLVISGICSSAVYVWFIFSYTFQWERQLDVSKKAASRARLCYDKLHKLMPKLKAPNLPPAQAAGGGR